MTAHDHATFVPGCYRCQLGRDEVAPASDPRLVALLGEHELNSRFYEREPELIWSEWFCTGCNWVGDDDDFPAHFAAVVEEYVQTRIAEALDDVSRVVRGLASDPCPSTTVTTAYEDAADVVGRCAAIHRPGEGES